jgi:beta-glucosidase
MIGAQSLTFLCFFPFGFGLSSTTFQITDAKLSVPEISPGVTGVIELPYTVINTGVWYRKFVVQLYVQSSKTSIGQPRRVEELKAFVKVGLEKGQSERVTMKLDKYSLSFYDEFDCCWREQKGVYRVRNSQFSQSTAVKLVGCLRCSNSI